MVKFEGKDSINTLLNIDNYFGEHETPMMPLIMFFAGAGLPLLAWIFFLVAFIPFKWFVGPWLLWTGRWALITLGKEKKKMKDWLQQRNDEYKAIDDLVHINQIYEDGLIEYSNGLIAYILTGMPKGYLNDKKLSVDMEEFMNELDMWSWDLYLHNATDEVVTENELPKLRAYKDQDVIQDRIQFFAYQDDYSRTHTSLYRYSFLVYGSKADWKRIRSHLENLLDAEVSKCFNELEICDRDGVNDIINRDICSYVDFVKMLTKKYENDNFKGSKVLWYDDKIPRKYKRKDKTTVKDIRGRRMVDDQ